MSKINEKILSTYQKCRIIRNIILNRTSGVMLYNWGDEFCTQEIRGIAEDVKNRYPYLMNIQPIDLTKRQMTDLGFGKWSKKNKLMLIPGWLYPFLAESIQTESISGENTLSKSSIDTDMRFGCLAYGVTPKS